MESSTAHTWLTPDGLPVSCIEKIKVLDQNLAEFRIVAQDILEDAALMGCDIEQVRAILAEQLTAVAIRYGEQ